MHKILYNIIQSSIDDAALNYCAYGDDTNPIVVMAINKNEVARFKALMDNEYLTDVTFAESTKSYYPPAVNTFGTIAFNNISNRSYLSGNTDLMLAVANELHKNGILFSGRVYKNYTSITVNEKDRGSLKYIKNAITKKREKTQSVLNNKNKTLLNATVVGEFLEFYGNDAEIVANAFELNLTTKDNQSMVGVVNNNAMLNTLGSAGFEILINDTPHDVRTQQFSELEEKFNDNMPDNSITLKDMRDYGYEYTGMLPLNKEKALELFDDDLTSVYLLYDDGTESQVNDRTDIINHNGIFGVEVDEWSKALVINDKNRGASERKAVIESNNEKDFSQQVDEVINGTLPFYTNLKVCDTPQILLSVGCEQLPMMYTQRHLKNAIKPIDSKNHHHGLSIEQIKLLPELINDPVMIFDSPNRKDSIIVVTSEVDIAENPIIISIKPNGKGRYELEEIDSNFITSVYGRNIFPQFVQRIIDSNNMLFCNKTKSQELFERWGEQYSELTNNLDFNIIIHQSRNIVKSSENQISEAENLAEQSLIDELMVGTGFQDGKFRLQEYYKKNSPSNQEFAKIVSKEYGIGGHTGRGNVKSFDCDSNGIRLKLINGAEYKFTWLNIAQKLSELIDTDTYITDKDIENTVRNAKFVIANPQSYGNSEVAKAEETLSKYDNVTEMHESTVVKDFKAKTEEMFHDINGYRPENIENAVKDFAIATFYNNSITAEIGNVAVTGSRSRGLENEDSDIDVVIEVNSDLKEDSLFNILNEDGMEIDGIKVDINPIRAQETGTLETYLSGVEVYLTEKAEQTKAESEKEKSGKQYDVFIYDGESKTIQPMRCQANNEREAREQGNSYIRQWHLVDAEITDIKEVQPEHEISLETDIDKAMELIDDYYQRTFGEEAFDYNAPIFDLSNINLANAIDEDTGLPIQASADLENYRMVYLYNGDIAREEQYKSLAEMNTEVFGAMEFNDLVALYDDEKIKCLQNKKEILLSEKTSLTQRYEDDNATILEKTEVLNDIESINKRLSGIDKNLKLLYKSYGIVVDEETNYPTITCQWSENLAFEDGKTYSVYEFENLMRKLDDERIAGKKAAIEKYGSEEAWYAADVEDEFTRFYGYDKTKFTINMPDGTQYTERQDVGDGEGGVISFLSQYDNYKDIVPLLERAYEEQAKNYPVEETIVEQNNDVTDFVITDDSLGDGGAKTKFMYNIAAIETLKLLERENRAATDEEKEILSKYVGWGGIPQAFDKNNETWNKEYTQLKDILTEKEYRQANASVLDAFYTAPVVIDGIYQALENFGFKGGNVLEPAMGVGNFFGKMPGEMRTQCKLYGIEIDSISGRIAQKLYPNADIAIKGFEDNSYQNGCFDVAVGNVPFGELNFGDVKHGTTKLHDYFFMETLDKVKNGGIVAFVTSAGTMDKRDSRTRQMIAERADLIGAIRLPGGKNGAFKDNAGTEVTTDIIFLQKNDNKTLVPDDEKWLSIGETADGLPINNYFADKPDMVLGKVIEGNKLYGSGTMVVAADDFDLKSELHTAIDKLSAEISTIEPQEVYVSNITNDISVDITMLRNHSLFINNDKIYFKNTNSSIETWKKDSSDAVHKRAVEYIKIRDCTRNILDAQERNCSDNELHMLQASLNTLYDNFYKKYGLMHSQTNKKYFSEDISYPLVCSLESKIDEDKLVEKSAIFSKRTIVPPEPITHVDTAEEALILSVAEKAHVDLAYMESLTDLSQEQLLKDLKGKIYPIPELSDESYVAYQEASEYLSGDIRKKLDYATKAAEDNPIFYDNIMALQEVMPEPLKAADISIKLGATWVEPEIYQQFMYECFSTPSTYRADKNYWWNKNKTEVKYSEYTNSWSITNKGLDRSVTVSNTYGIPERSAYKILEDVLNLRDPKVYKKDYDADGKEIRVIDYEPTKQAQQKANKIREKFKDWVFSDPDRRTKLVDKYNQLFNSIRPREYDGSHLSFPGMNADIELHSHQKNAIAHALYGGNTLFAHSVGAGKTFEMIATAMESKRLGLCTKSLFAVPNHLTEQIGDDFLRLYPNANILVATKNDFKKGNRQKLVSKIATGDFDAVIIGHTQLGMIPISKERQEYLLELQIQDVIRGIEKLKLNDGEKFNIKAMERTKKSLQKQLEKLKKSNQDDIITFEQLGVDKLFIDEAHEFKNLFCATKLQNVAGISTSASQRALDLFMKCQYLDEKTNGKGVVFATGTPVSNSVTELHTMMRYLQYDLLKDKQLNHFDNWVSIFGEQKTEYELAPAGNSYRPRTRIANYVNLPELLNMFKQCADVKTADTLNLDVPTCHLHVVNAEPTEFQKELVAELSSRADDVQTGKVDPTEDNMLKITSDGRKVGLDPRLIDPMFEDNPNSKLNQCVDNVARIHRETSEDKLTQIIFCDLGVPHGNKKTEKDVNDDNKSVAEVFSFEEECDFNVYDDIKAKLVSKGIPENEIAFIHSAKTEKAKSELFEKVRNGEVRILIGSTGKMGTGTNVQDRLVALHDLDIPWRPADLDQRQGRVVRQGNINKEVHLYRYVTKGTFDAYSYQLLESKQKFISQIITSKSAARTCDDVDQQSLSYSEIKALCTGDERIKELMILENDVKNLTIVYKDWQNTQYEMQDIIKDNTANITKLEKLLSAMSKDLDIVKTFPLTDDGKLAQFSITIQDKVFTDKTEAAKALEAACIQCLNPDGASARIGALQGFPIEVYYSHADLCLIAELHGAAKHKIKLTDSFPHNLRRLESLLLSIEKRIENTKLDLTKLTLDVQEAEKLLSMPFEYEKELEEKSERLSNLQTELNEESAKAVNNNKCQQRTYYFEKAKLKNLTLSSKNPKNSLNLESCL